MSIKNIAVIMAMMDEAKPLIDTLGLKKKIGAFPGQLPMEVFFGNRGNMQVNLIWNGKDLDYNVDNIGYAAGNSCRLFSNYRD